MAQTAIGIIKDLFYFPSFGRGVICVWQRNFQYFRRTVLMTFFWIILEPVLYLFAIGYGLGHLVNEVQGVSYAQFYAPALIATSGMFISFFDGCYGSFTKLARQNTYNTILLSPISASEIVLGEIAWSASKGFLSVLGVTFVALVMGLINTWLIFPALGVAFLLCWFFSAFGVLMSAYAKNYDFFIYSQSGFIIPMSLFSGTFFPLEQLPLVLQKIAYLFPLTHGVMGIRSLMSGEVTSSVFLNVAILFAMGALMTNWASARMERRIVI